MIINNKMIKKAIAMLIPLILYFFAILLHNDFWINILSSVNAFVAAGILLFSYIKSDHRNKMNITFVLYSISCFLWGVSDILWIILEFWGKDPLNDPMLCSIYFLTNFFLIVALFTFSVMQLNKWNYVQLYIDSFIIGSMSLMLLWITCLHKDLSILNTMFQSDFTSVFSVISDIFIAIGVISWLFSVRSGKIPLSIKILSSGILLYAFTDILYYYADFNAIYIPNSFIDFSYILALQIMAFGALWKTYYCSSVFELSELTNVGNTKRWAVLFIYPLAVILLESFGVVEKNIKITDIIVFVFLIFFYRASCKYVQISIENERLLEHEKRMNEILEQRVAEQVAELTFLENQDTLTSLFNRQYFFNCVNESIQSILSNELLALLLIDIDRFKTVNDNFGHDIGDKVLLDLSYRMMEWNRYGAVLSRLGGDEFAIMFVGKYTRKEIEEYCSEIIEFCNKPINIGTETLHVTISVGIALFSPDACDRKTLMNHADMAMYRAKSQGYNKYQFYDPLFSEDMNRNSKIEILLKQTNIAKDFELFYQPQFSLPEKKLIGAEALIRWNSAEHGYIPPNVFIPVAEEINYIFKIGEWVMEKTIKQAIKWNKIYQLDLKLGFNISPKQFQDDKFVDTLNALISETGVNTAWLDAEVTENVMITKENRVDAVFELLKKRGISISIDDFGSGYSSLAYLNKYLFDRIKIDKSLIDNVSSQNICGVNIVKAAISMAKAVGIKTIAEGVETQEQLDILAELGCDEVQGYLLGRPVPADIFEQEFLCIDNVFAYN